MILPEFNRIYGWRVIECGSWTKITKRGWRDRLFSLPWQPRRKYNEELVPIMKDGEIIMNENDRLIICNAATKIKVIRYAEGMPY